MVIAVRRDIIHPNYRHGFARNAAEAARPQDWVGLVGLWLPSLGPSGLTLFDYSGRSNHGALTSMDAATDWIISSGHYALDFDGSNDHIQMSAPANPVYDFERTDKFSCVIIGNKVGTAADRVWLGKMDGAPNFRGYDFYGDTSNNLNVQIRSINPSNGIRVSGGSILGDDEHYLVFTYDGSSTAAGLILYVDGVAETPTVVLDALTGTIITSQILNLGSQDNGIAPVNGFIKQARIYNRVLTPNEILEQSQDLYGIIRRKRRQYIMAEQVVAGANRLLLIHPPGPHGGFR